MLYWEVEDDKGYKAQCGFSGALFLVFDTWVLCVALELVLEVALVDQAGLKLTEICLYLTPECWN